MIYEIKNETLSVKIDTVGGQMKSFCLSDGTELLWQGNPDFWRSQAPILFPIVGALRDNKATIGSLEMEIPKHGLAKLNEFTLESVKDDEVTLELKANDDTKKAYPFEFSFKIKIALIENGLVTSYIVKNLDDKEMPFFVGAHPGFNVPFEAGYKFEDYSLCFAEKENLSSPVIITETSIYDYTKKKLEYSETDCVALDNELFSNDVFVFENLKKNEISIKNNKTQKAIQMNFEEFPMIGIWKPYNESPFVCLEPWVGCSTTTTEDNEFTNKKHCQILNSGEEKSYSFTLQYK